MIKPTEKVCPVCGGKLPKSVKRWEPSTSCARLNYSEVWIKGCDLQCPMGWWESTNLVIISTMRQSCASRVFWNVCNSPAYWLMEKVCQFLNRLHGLCPRQRRQHFFQTPTLLISPVRSGDAINDWELVFGPFFIWPNSQVWLFSKKD